MTHFFVDDDTLERALTTKTALNYFHVFDAFLSSNNQNFNNLVDSLIVEYIQSKQPIKFQKIKYKRTLNILLSNLLYCHQTSAKLYLVISRTSGWYSSDKRYNPMGLNATVICNLVDWLEEKNYIIQFKGTKFGNNTSRTRIRSKKTLIDVYKKMNVLSALIISPLREVIILKDVEKKPQTYSDNKETNRMRVCVERLNALLKKTKLELNSSQLPTQHLHRVFNDGSFKLGGRFYGGSYQNLPKTDRKNLLVNGSPVTELDFSTIHPNILYSKVKQAMPNDPYLPINYPLNARDFLKLFFLIILNSANENQAIQAGLILASKKHRGLGYNTKLAIKAVLQDLKMHNRQIQKYFCKCEAKRLMYIDSKIAESVITRFVKLKIPIYPVHDSFIVPVAHGALLKQAMIASYQHEVGSTIRVDKVY
ncbi:MAG: hypothetical protein ABL930_04610 [Pseudobdellovibrio sp.]